MHTSSGVDNVDEFAEKIEPRGKAYCYRYGSDLPAGRRAAGHHPLSHRRRQARRCGASPTFAHPSRPDRPRGKRPLDRVRDDGQAGRGAAAELPAHQGERPRSPSCRSRELKANSSNNTMFADGKGEIALSASRSSCPRRNDRFDYTQAGRRQRSRDRLGRAPRADRACPASINPPNGWVDEHQ